MLLLYTEYRQVHIIYKHEHLYVQLTRVLHCKAKHHTILPEISKQFQQSSLWILDNRESANQLQKKKEECLWCNKSSILGILQEVCTSFLWVYIWTRDKVTYHSDDRDQHSKIPCCPWGLQHTKQKTIQHTKQSAIQSYKPYTIFSSHNLGQIRM